MQGTLYFRILGRLSNIHLQDYCRADLSTRPLLHVANCAAHLRDWHSMIPQYGRGVSGYNKLIMRCGATVLCWQPAVPHLSWRSLVVHPAICETALCILRNFARQVRDAASPVWPRSATGLSASSLSSMARDLA